MEHIVLPHDSFSETPRVRYVRGNPNEPYGATPFMSYPIEKGQIRMLPPRNREENQFEILMTG